MSARPLVAIAAALALAVACRHAEPAPEAAAADAQRGSPPRQANGQTTARPQPAPEAAAAAADPRAAVPKPGPAPALKVPPQRHFQLSNGLRVRLVEYHRLPIVALHLVVDAGALHDPPNKPGLASFTAAMMTEGTKRRTATRISDDLGFLGASLSAGAGFDSASLSGSVLTSRLDGLLDVFADVLLHPIFPKGDFARVQDSRLVSLIQQRDVPGAVASKAFAKLYWGDHPYGHWLLGTEGSLKAMRREDLARYHAARWRPGAAELVVVGDVTEEVLRAKLERVLGAWKGGAPPPTKIAFVQPGRLQTVLIEKAKAPQAFVMMGMPGFERSAPDYVPAEVAFQVLGGGMSSRLFRNLREKEGYTYGIYARSESRKLGGTSFIVGSVKSDVTGPATKALLQEIQELRDTPVPDPELDVARNSLLLSLPGDFATAAGIAGKLAEEVIYGLPDDYWDSYAAEVAKVSADDVRRIAQRYLDPAKLTTVMVRDAGAVKPQLAGLPLGDVEVRAGPTRGGKTPADTRAAR
ncbi:MAG: M16 family metallopeptidase [Anaeromyxobacteraceae bacterium]